MGQFLKNDHADNIDKLTAGVESRLQNRFYKFNDKNPVKVTFYNINTQATTLDSATKDAYAQVSPESSFRFDKIEGTILYGMSRVQLDGIDEGEFGPEANPVEGEVYLPPNTFKPYQNSYYVIDYLKTGKRVFFKITGVQLDTLPNGANGYQMTYKMDLFDADIEKQVVRTFRMVSGNIGTDLKSVVETTEYDLVYRIQEECDTLRSYYMDLFFKGNIQTFVYRYQSDDVAYFYDPFMIEFLIRNKIMYGKTYEHICHQVYLPRSFNIDYDSTLFRSLEKKNLKINCPKSYATLITDPMSLMSVRLENYYSIAYTDEDGEKIQGVLADTVDTIDPDLIDAILNNKEIDGDDEKNRMYYNIIIAYMNDGKITEALVDTLSTVRYVRCKELFYTLPMVIFSLEKYAYAIMSDTSGKKL